MSPRVTLTLALVLAAGAGCTKILGLDYQYQGTGGGTTSTTVTASTTSGETSPCGSFEWDTLPTCQKCMEASCCTELGACDKGSACDELMICERKCDQYDDVCKQTCLTADTSQHAGSGFTAYNNVYTCYLNNCEYTSGCDWPVCNSTFLWNDHKCADCLSTGACCDALTACGGDSVCSSCVTDPANTPGCSGNAKYMPVDTCLTTTCAKQCNNTICGSTLGYPTSDCNDCVDQMMGGCCTEFAMCTMDMTSACYKCMYGTMTTGCTNDAQWNAWSNCVTNNCNAACAFW